MELNLEQKVRSITGEPLLNEHEKLVYLKDILTNVALADIKEDGDTSNKITDFNIAMQLNNADKTVKLETKQIGRLQEKLPKIYNTLIVGQVNEMLNGDKNPLEPKSEPRSVKNESK